MKPMPNLNEFAKLCHEASERKGWTNLNRSDAATINLMVSELSEALEDFRNHRKIDELYHENNYKPCGIPIELADVIVRIGQQCGTHQIDLEAAFNKVIKHSDVVSRFDFNEMLADATMRISMAWLSCPQANGRPGHGKDGDFSYCLAAAMRSVLLFCEAQNIDIWHWVEVKMAFNETREKLHGGKRI